MSNLPEAREDGICCDCLRRQAETNCGRWCKKCLRKRIRDDTPIPHKQMFSDERGRKCRSSQVLGGTTDMRTTDELE